MPFWQSSTRFLHTPATQPCVEPHAWPHMLQFWLSVCRFTQVLLHAVNGVVQFVLHWPPEHTWFESVQFVLQSPQCVSSFVVSKHCVPHRVSAPQSIKHLLWTQMVPPGQAWLHFPQLLLSAVVSTHVSTVIPVGVHAVSPGSQGGEHLPAVHRSEPVQAVLQSPQ